MARLDDDLSFTEMVDFLSSDSYAIYLNATLETPPKEPIVDPKAYQNEYRRLSNTVHGKLATFEATRPGRYSFCVEEWSAQLQQTVDVLLFITPPLGGALSRSKATCVREHAPA